MTVLPDERLRAHKMAGGMKRLPIRPQPSRQGMTQPASTNARGGRHHTLLARRVIRAGLCSCPAPAATLASATAGTTAAATVTASTTPLLNSHASASVPLCTSRVNGDFSLPEEKLDSARSHRCFPQQELQVDRMAIRQNNAEVQGTAPCRSVLRLSSAEVQNMAAVLANDLMRPSRSEMQRKAEVAHTAAPCPRRILEAGELRFVGTAPDPAQPQTLRQVLASIGANSGTVEKLAGFQGGLNDGVWALREASCTGSRPREWIIKLVKAIRTVSTLPTEAQNLLRIAHENPAMLSDPLLAFPTAILSCVDGTGVRTHDLLIMRRAPGERLCEVLARKWHSGQHRDCWMIIEKVGVAAAEFHARYANVQHGDFQPANVFWDESTSCVTLIDVGGMGIATCDGDVQHFTQSMGILATAYGSLFKVDGIAAFHRGYQTSVSNVRGC